MKILEKISQPDRREALSILSENQEADFYLINEGELLESNYL